MRGQWEGPKPGKGETKSPCFAEGGVPSIPPRKRLSSLEPAAFQGWARVGSIGQAHSSTLPPGD